MKIKRFFAKDMRSALNDVKAELGADAIIMSNKKVSGGIELVAAVDYEASQSQAAQKKQEEESLKQVVSNKDALQQQLAAFKQKRENKQSSGGKNPFDLTASSQEEDPMANAPQNLKDFLNKHKGTIQASQPQAQTALAEPEKATAAVTSSDDAIVEMREELNALRQMLEFQVSGLMRQELQRKDPKRAYLISKLSDLGIEEDVAEQITQYLPKGLKEIDAWKHVVQVLIDQIGNTNNDIINSGGVISLVGPTGAGKTTTAAKLAARFALKHGKEHVALVSADSYRIGAQEQLATYARIIGCSVKQAKNAEELSEVLYQLRNKKLVIIDTAGIASQDLKLNRQLTSLMKNASMHIKNYLVLQSNSQLKVLQQNVVQFSKLAITGCIFTKLDESLSLGEIISLAIQNSLPISYLTDGQRVPEDIKVADAKYLVAKAVKLMKKHKQFQTRSINSRQSTSVTMYG